MKLSLALPRALLVPVALLSASPCVSSFAFMPLQLSSIVRFKASNQQPHSHATTLYQYRKDPINARSTLSQKKQNRIFPTLKAAVTDDNSEQTKKQSDEPPPSTSSPSDTPKKKKKKKKKLVINRNLAETTISSDGIFEGKTQRETKPVKSNLGVPSKRKKTSDQKQTPKTVSSSSKKEKLHRQRTAGGTIDSTVQTILSNPEDQQVQIQVSKRGSKSVTIIRGLTSTMEDRKKLLKELKSKLGGGGSIIEGVLELQGSHADKVLEHLKAKGYSKARVVGK